jgi:hypothetical protein
MALDEGGEQLALLRREGALGAEGFDERLGVGAHAREGRVDELLLGDEVELKREHAS